MDEKVTTSGRVIRRPVELYHQNCVMKATIMENARNKKKSKENNKKRVQRSKDKKKKTKRRRLR